MYKASKVDVERAKNILKEESEKMNFDFTIDELENLTIKILDICYSIGGAYEESTIREIVKIKLAEWHK